MFYFDNFYGKKVLKSTLLDDCEHFFTTRDFVLCEGNRQDLKNIAAQNVDFLMTKSNIEEKDLYRCKQMHTSNIKVANNDNNFFDNTDAIILVKKNTAAFLNFADCIPIILYDSVMKIGAVVHAGWRGTALKIQQKTVNMMCQYGSNPKNIKAAIGPGIGLCCFEVDKDVFDKIFKELDITNFHSTFKKNIQNDKYNIDLKLLNKILLNEVLIQNIDISDYCTCCSNDLFFSYRKELKNTARHSAYLKIKG
ncbi:peptidoglycan editing factor PgeF [bacterium]|nr:peptidoglycan editing factor PgeF [bacterium]